MKERTTPSSCARKASSSVPSRATAAGESVVNFGFSHFLGLHFHLQIPCPYCCIGVHYNTLSEPVHYSAPTFLQQTWYDHPDWDVTIFLLVCSELERVDQVVAGSLWCHVRPKNFSFSAVGAVMYGQDHVRGPPFALAATNCTPPSPDDTHQT